MKKTIIIALISACLGYVLLAIYIDQVGEKIQIEDAIRNSAKYKEAKKDFEYGIFDQPFIVFQEFLNKHPEQDWLRVEIGDMYAEIKDYEKALDHYFNIKSLKDLSLGERQVFLRIGLIYEKLGNIDSAVFYYNQILQSESPVHLTMGYDNDRESAFCRLGEIAFKKSNYDKAIKYFSKAIEIERNPKPLYIRANAYYLTGKPDLAEKDYYESIGWIRKIYVNKNPHYKNILCDTCGTFFGREEYMAVLQEWRSFDEKMRDNRETLTRVTSSQIYKIIADSFPKWDNEIESLKDKKDYKSLQRRKALTDSINKYGDTVITSNIYD